MLYIQPVYAQTSLIESIKQKASELALIKLAVATGVSAVTTYHTAKGFVQDMVSSAPDVFNEFKDSVVDSANKLKFALVASDTVWQGTKAFLSGLNKPINEPITYYPSDLIYENAWDTTQIPVSSVSVDIRLYYGGGKFNYEYTYNGITKKTTHSTTSYFPQESTKQFTLPSEFFSNTNGSYSLGTIPIPGNEQYSYEVIATRNNSIIEIFLNYNNQQYSYRKTTFDLSSVLSAGYDFDNLYYEQYQYADGTVYSPDGTITLDPRSIDPEDDFLNDKTGDTPKRLVGFPLPWSELPSVSEGVINDGIDLGELSTAQLEAIDLTLQGLLEQVDTLTTDLVRTEDLLREALVNPPIDTTGVIPAIESIGNIITNAFNPPTLTIDFTPLKSFNILTDKFPFSLPWDLRDSFLMLLDEPDPPIFNIPFKFGGIMEGVELDFTIFDPVIGLFRWLLLIAFTISLIYFSTIYL